MLTTLAFLGAIESPHSSLVHETQPDRNGLLRTPGKRHRVVVTGGAGYVGSHTVHALARAGVYDLLVIDNLESGHAEAVPRGVALKVLALDDAIGVAAVLKAFRPHALIDFAAYLDVSHSQSEPEEYVRNNVQNFKHVVRRLGHAERPHLPAAPPTLPHGRPPLLSALRPVAVGRHARLGLRADHQVVDAGDLRRRAPGRDAAPRGLQRRGHPPLRLLQPRRWCLERYQAERPADLRAIPWRAHRALPSALSSSPSASPSPSLRKGLTLAPTRPQNPYG